MRGVRFALMVGILAAGSLHGPTSGPGLAADLDETVLNVEGAVPQPLKLTADAFARLPRQSVRIKDRAGAEVEYQGVLVAEVLKAAGVKFGEDLRGAALASYLIVAASDGYRAAFSLAELDPSLTDRVVLLADRRDGKPLDKNEGPFRIVIPAETRHSRWVRQVVALKVGRG